MPKRFELGLWPHKLIKAIQRQDIVQKISRSPFEGGVFLVGGAIRELVLGKFPKDYDFAITNPDDLGVFEKALGAHAFLLGKKPIKTYRIVSQDLSLDLTFLETSIAEDLSRRDFTMNAIAYDVRDGKLIDSLGGFKDIHDGVIRCPRRKALTDDPLRMLKAVRHFATMEGFTLDGELVDAIHDFKHLILSVAPERIRYEMDQIVISPNAYGGLTMLQQVGLLFQLFPELHALKRLDQEQGFVLSTYGHTLEGYKYLKRYGDKYGLDERDLRNVAYALLFHDIGKAHTFSRDEKKNVVHFFHHERFSATRAALIMEKLRFSTVDNKTVCKLIEHHMRIFLISNSDSTEKAIRRLVYRIGELTPLLVVLTLCDMYGSSGGTENESTFMVTKRCDELLEAHKEWQKKPLPRLVNGHDLLAIGFEQGPRMGKVLHEIREKQLNGELVLKDEALAYARNHLKETVGS